MSKKTFIELFFLFLLISAFSYLLFYRYSALKNFSRSKNLESKDPYSVESQKKSELNQKDSLPSPTLFPKPIPHGKRGFTVSLGSKIPGPRMGKGFIDPYDPPVSGDQTVTIEVNNFDLPIEKVTAFLKTDNKTSPKYLMKQVDGTANQGNWSGSWKVDDSYFYTYLLTIEATGQNGTSKVTITLR